MLLGGIEGNRFKGSFMVLGDVQEMELLEFYNRLIRLIDYINYIVEFKIKKICVGYI